MRGEKDYKDGETVIYSNFELTHNYTGIVDYSEGEEKEGFVRIRRVFTESPDEGNVSYVPVGFIYGSN